jgi:hypothetical protein
MGGGARIKGNGDKPEKRVFRTKRKGKEQVLMKPKSRPETGES